MKSNSAAAGLPSQVWLNVLPLSALANSLPLRFLPWQLAHSFAYSVFPCAACAALNVAVVAPFDRCASAGAQSVRSAARVPAAIEHFRTGLPFSSLTYTTRSSSDTEPRALVLDLRGAVSCRNRLMQKPTTCPANAKYSVY